MIEVYADSVEEAMAVWQEVRGEEAAWGEYREFANRGLKYFVEESLKDAVSRKIGVSWYARSDGRTGHRNGFYERLLVTPYGSVTIQVPRVREGSYEHELFGRQKLLTEEVGSLVMDAYLAGISTRRVGEVLDKMLGYRISAGTVSEICKGLDKLVREYWRRPIADKWRYLIFDAIVVKNRSAVGSERRYVLVAVGIDVEGNREILAFKQVESESEVAWEAFVLDLFNRGLAGKHVELITTDGNKGVIAALDTVWPYVERQRCWFHKQGNIAGKVRKKNEGECLGGVRRIYLATSRTEAVRNFREWVKRWKDDEPGAVACLAQDIEELLSIFNIPEEHRVKMRTTNLIERVFREVKRRTRPMNCFTNRRSVDRMLYAILARQNKLWSEGRPLPNFTHSA
ncbi:MAG: IS256 family transposase [Armatimonadetes bacterium]|nr:IS256 family transposase [Armatimonadota bacterium]NIO97623.1 IS256 family transposase [Armatimonadota bacterium]